MSCPETAHLALIVFDNVVSEDEAASCALRAATATSSAEKRRLPKEV